MLLFSATLERIAQAQSLDAPKRAAALVDALSPADRLALFLELVAKPGKTPFDIDASALYQASKRRLYRDLDKRAAAYAKKHIGDLISLEKRLRRDDFYPSELGVAFYMALVRGNVPIEARWEVFAPFCGEPDAIVLEGARAMRNPKRAGRVLARKLANDPSGFAVQRGLALLAVLPSAALTDAVLDRCALALTPPLDDAARIRREIAAARKTLAALGKRHAVIAARLAART